MAPLHGLVPASADCRSSVFVFPPQLTVDGNGQVCLLGGASESGPASDTWQLALSAGDDGKVGGTWRQGLPLEAGRSWHTATPLSTAEARLQVSPAVHSLGMLYMLWFCTSMFDKTFRYRVQLWPHVERACATCVLRSHQIGCVCSAGAQRAAVWR